MINLSIRPDKVKELIQLIVDNEKAWDVVKTIHWQDTFLFIYDDRKSADVNTDFPNSEYNVNDFKSDATVAVKFQILSHNFKAFIKVDAVKVYLFWLLGVYFVDYQALSTMLTLDKRQRGDNK